MSRPAAHDATIQAATDVQQNAHCPYSDFPVGAALLDRSGGIHVGVNVENASYGLTICAERSALCVAVSRGVQEFDAIAISTHAPDFCPPCGACLQCMSEFCDADMAIYLVNNDEVRATSLRELQPFVFDKHFFER